jgi:ketosteroid isomerase-like protein
MSTTTEQNKAIIRRFFDAWNSRQPHAFDDLIAPDVVRHCEATPGVEARNLDQVKEFLRQNTAVFPILSKRSSFWSPGGILLLR